MMKPEDPTTVRLVFFSDGRIRILTRNKSGGESVTGMKPEADPDRSVVILTANPGGTGEQDERGAHKLTGQGAYFAVDIRRMF